ncbi:hypothetical protein JHL21_00010 [Devosia sp. WQ 349]|uniref:peroxidase family protein n=1 Tax=Devosia sp. WQ 349K1 TaxID=2800329 RepID=UPI001906CB55|nr:peroxidase family protein [Devosia sp. WQ 349K1]MBK1792876.1 hypothetical protein [Devosia sp. WQ 349K1]
MVTLVRHDLEFILKQIKIAERHSSGESLTTLVAEAGGVDASSSASEQVHLLPYGLRTVDGSYNNLLPGRQEWGAAEQPFPQLTDPSWVVGSGSFPAGSGYPTNNQYILPGNVVDIEPRIISNLIVDQTLGNPAAIIAALEHAGVTGQAQAGAVIDIQNAFSAVRGLSPNSDAFKALWSEVKEAVERYGITMDGTTIHLPNVSPDIGDSAPYSAIFTLFGQFFDHGLDLVAKGGNGTVYIPLQTDDPLYNPGSPHTNFMVLTRVSTGADAKNTTTPWVDQNQTYGSHASKQVFLREYKLVDGNPVETGYLLGHETGGLATWADVKQQARTILGIDLSDADVSSIPLIATDEYGNFIRGKDGYPQFVKGVGSDGILGTADDVLVQGNPQAPVSTVGVARTAHAFIDDIAHNAVPGTTYFANGQAVVVTADNDTDVGNQLSIDTRGNKTAYDNELLEAHFVTGDGRGNENIGLTMIHHIFHGEHNLIVEQTKKVALDSADLAFLNEWLLVKVMAIPADPSTLVWDGARLFQAARFVTEMEYQHLVFEEFARKMQPDVDLFLFEPDPDINPAIFAEFANVVYRFGHSMLNETVDLIDADGKPTQMALFDAFLNPLAYESAGITHDAAAGAIIRGMSTQVGNEVDEFITNTLRNQLLGIPLDLASINIARGRDTGMPTLNEAREQFQAMAHGDTQLKPYESWVDFALNLKNPASIVNFVAAYGTHPLILAAQTVEAKRDAAMSILGLGEDQQALTSANGDFEAGSLASGAPGVNVDANGNYTVGSPNGWRLTGTGGVFDPADNVINQPASSTNQVGWLAQNASLTKVTDHTLAAGEKFSLTLKVGDRLDTDWPGGVVRLVTSNGTVIASKALTQPADGGWATVTLETGAIPAGLAGQGLSVVIENTGGTSGQMLVDDVSLSRLVSSNVADRVDFLNGTGAWATKETGLNLIDLWVGGLAEKKMDFGGMLGSTFAFIFELQMENLQDADRFYYLSRTQGLNLLSELESNSLAKMMLRNTDLDETGTAIPGDIFSRPDLVLYADLAKQIAMTGLEDPVHENAYLQAISKLVERGVNGTGFYLRYSGGEHALVQGSDGDDRIITGDGDDSIWGGKGNDRIEGGYGVDHLHGGDGDDIITNAGTDIGEIDFLHGEGGNDVIHGGSGKALIFGNSGHDFLIAGPDGKTVMGGTGNDFILGGDGMDFLMGEAGDDWIEGGGRFDTLSGENSELMFNSSIQGNDVLNGQGGDTDYDAEAGDDIMFQGTGIQRNNGMAGFDWAIHKDDPNGANSDLGIPLFTNQEAFILRDRFDLVEGLSGWKHDDNLTGRVVPVNTRVEATGTAAIPAPGMPLYAYSNALLERNVALINGLDNLVAHLTAYNETGRDGITEKVLLDTADASDILLGGGGSDRIKGLAGNDIVDGDKWLNVRILIVHNGTNYTADGMSKQVFLETDMVNGVLKANANAQFGGKGLDALMLEGVFNPGALSIVREIVDGRQTGDIDTAVFTGIREHYTFGVNKDHSLYLDHAPPASDETDPLTDNIEGVTQRPVLDGRDTVRNIERLEFTDLTMNVINGTDAVETLNGDQSGTGLIHDVLMGFGGKDVLNGHSGNDVLIGGLGDDTLNGGSGDDIYVFGIKDGSDVITETSGDDRISLALNGAALDSFNIVRSNNTNSNTSNSLSILLNGHQIRVNNHFGSSSNAVETVTFDGGSYKGYDFYLADDEGDEVFRGTYVLNRQNGSTLTAAADVNTILATSNSATDRTLTGNTGHDMLFGGAGNDMLNGGAGIDLLVGGAGNDTYIVDDLGDTVVELANGGNDTIRTSLPSYNLDDNVENLTHTGTGDFTGAGNNLNNVITGGAGNDSLYGEAGNDTLNGGTGDDYLDGGAGNDTLNGGDGNDSLFGGVGDDTLNGGAGNDYIDGGDGNDTLDGSLGDDVVHGGAGNDIIYVGSGNDTVVYNTPGFGTDTIRNFDTNNSGGQDLIDLRGLGITSQNFSARVTIGTVTPLQGSAAANGGNSQVAITVKDAAGSTIGTINIRGTDLSTNASNSNAITAADFLLGVVAPINGSNSSNTLNGTAGNDVINGWGGNDTISGHAGDDSLDGGDGNDTINGGAGNDTINGGSGNDVINGGTGDDIINGGTGNDDIFGGSGDDTVHWNAQAANGSAGWDVIDGGSEGIKGDTLVITGQNNVYEIFRFYPFEDAQALFPNATFRGTGTEIVVSRTVVTNGIEGTPQIIAELSEIEEIAINGSGASGEGMAGGDRYEFIGDFAEQGEETSLRLNTITINGSGGDDTVDISKLTSAHRIVFRTRGGNDTIIGKLRPQDVVLLPLTTTVDDYDVVENIDGTTTVVGEDYSINFFSPGGLPQFEIDDGSDGHLAPPTGEPGDEEEPIIDDGDTGGNTGGNGNGDDDDEGNDSDNDDEDDDDGVVTPQPGTEAPVSGNNNVITGTSGDDVLNGTNGRDIMTGGAGDDIILGGKGADMIFGQAGDDRIFGEDGNDILDGGKGNDTIVGGAGDDIFLANDSDGNDVYYGDEVDGGAGNDTLDMGTISAGITADLGTGHLGRGSAQSSQTGIDTLWGIENITTGSGNDTITASSAINVIDGGVGNDTFRFLSAADADGDTIMGFQPGDKIDLSAMDADWLSAGKQSFTLVSGAFSGARGELLVTQENRDGVDFTIVHGNASGGQDADFKIAIKGSHTFTASDFDL